MRIGKVKDALGVPVPTLRRWTQEFAPGLSADALASDGRPREFSPRDLRLLRRAKEILSGEDVTYERARRTLAGEGLLTQPEMDPQAGGVQRDDTAAREAAEQFVRDIVARSLTEFVATQSRTVSRLEQLEREVQALRVQLASAPNASPATPGELRTDAPRRGWPRFP